MSKAKLATVLGASTFLLLGGVAFAWDGNESNQGNNELITRENKVTICHRTDSERNPWVVETINKSALLAHLKLGDKLYPGRPGTKDAELCDRDHHRTPSPSPSPSPSSSVTPTPIVVPGNTNVTVTVPGTTNTTSGSTTSLPDVGGHGTMNP